MTDSADEQPTLASNSWRRFRPLWLVVACAVAGLLAPIRIPGRLTGVIFDSAHLPTFLVVTWTAIGVCDRRGTGWALPIGLATVIGILGAGAELVQALVGRSAQLGDAISNAVGCGIGFVAATRHRWPPAWLWLAGILSMVMAGWVYAGPAKVLVDMRRQARAFPVLASFENDLELTRWVFRNATATRSDAHASDGTQCLEVTLKPGRAPRAEQHSPAMDWREFDVLSFDTWVSGDGPLELTLRIEDFEHMGAPSDRFERKLSLAPGHSNIIIDLSDIRTAPATRLMDMSLVSRIQLYAVSLGEPRTFYLDGLVLR